ncbi:MAG: TIGR01212 family radical SAM protein, partial [Lachnospiraceae bacterium]|nr:TIGR01212 family radical SAM protein [Lachnospiraceae bacterium]
MRLLGEYLRSRFGCKVYKVALNGGFTCPNRDGTLGTRGCIFCSAGGSGEFAESSDLSITDQIERGKERVWQKMKDGRYIAYFQAYTGTYAPVSTLRALFTEAIMHPDVVAISVATRPDCLPPETLDLLAELNEIKPVWVELGLQTIYEETARYIRRGYDLPVYDRAVKNLRERDIEAITHVILGLPGEAEDDMVETVKYVCASGANGIKLQLLHILRGTDLEQEYNAGRVKILTEDEYIRILRKCVAVIPEDV